MPGKYERKKKHSPLPWILMAVLLAGLGCAGLYFREDIAGLLTPPETTLPVQSTTVPTTAAPTETTAAPTTEAPTTVPTTVPEETEPLITGTASFTVTGDLLMHRPVFDDYLIEEPDVYDFDPMMEFLEEYVSPADYAIANLETTFAGLENGFAYSGNPFFNCPDQLADTCVKVGFDMLLTVNNHCYDTRTAGVKRTIEIVTNAGMDPLGTQASAEDPDYLIKEINGIKIGMTAYTFETNDGIPGLPSINAITCTQSDIPLINSFDYNQLKKFYTEIQAQVDAMNAEGAEAIVVFMHWGNEYELKPSDYQKKMAQALCDLGVDVIVGGHPHVIQPVELLTATEDESHKTLCIYSLGNLISNQRAEEMRMKTGHTEDGLFFNFTFAKYTDGTVMLTDVNAIPIWVQIESYRYGYHILPLDDATRDTWMEKYGIDETVFADCEDSFDRTMKLVGPGIEEAMEYYNSLNESKIAELRKAK